MSSLIASESRKQLRRRLANCGGFGWEQNKSNQHIETAQSVSASGQLRRRFFGVETDRSVRLVKIRAIRVKQSGTDQKFLPGSLKRKASFGSGGVLVRLCSPRTSDLVSF